MSHLNSKLYFVTELRDKWRNRFMKSTKQDKFDSKFKNIHIGSCIELRVNELNIPIERVCSFLNTDKQGIQNVYSSSSLDTELLLRWSKLLKYDFFRLYSQHLILYAPIAADSDKESEKTELPRFRKNVYTQEVIDFIMEQLNTNQMTTAKL